MATVCEDFIIDVSHEQSFKYLQAKQFDHNSRKRRLIITDSNVPIQYSNERTEYITLSLSINGNNYSNTSCPFESDGYPYITFTESMLSKFGDVNCEVRIYDHINGTIITTFTFMMTISKSLLNHERLVKSSEFDILNNLILQALTIKDLYKEYEANKKIIDAYIVQINNDIKSYQSQFNTLSNDAKQLISDVTIFLNDSRQAELERVTAENERIKNEIKRQNDTSAAIINANEATRLANEATANANEATENAISATDDANEATRLANEATTNANEATRLANEATENANSATNNANEATSNANEATRLANEAIDNAIDATDDANTAARLAIEATDNANTAASNANEATVNAQKSANSALTARDQCLAAIEGLHWEIKELDNGNAFDEIGDYEDTFDGGYA